MEFSRRARTRVLLLLPVLATVSWLAWEIARPRMDGVADGVANGEMAEVAAREGAGNGGVAAGMVVGGGAGYAVSDATGSGAGSGGTGKAGTGDGNVGAEVAPRLFEFDPNTVSYHDLVRLGFTRGEALGIVKYRERGKVFEIAEDFAACYQVSEAAYLRLAPYIRIAERFRLKPFASRGSAGRGAATDGTGGTGNAGGKGAGEQSARGSNDSETAQYAERDAVTTASKSAGGAGMPQNAGTVQNAGHHTPPRMMSAAVQSPAPVDLNTADSAALIAVRGIGPRTVVAIMEYRARLGGFARVEQLAEVRGVTEQNYALMLEQIYVDPAVIQKIDINFAPAKLLAAHPYIRAEALRKLLKQRQLKGGWRTAPELEQENIFTADELSRLGPYLDFK